MNVEGNIVKHPVGGLSLVGDVETLYNEKFFLVTFKSIIYRVSLSLATVANLLTVSIYVAYRSPHPDEATVKSVSRMLQEKNIQGSRLLEWPRDHCQHAESSTTGGISALNVTIS
jgi:hypothetical protein